ncbi:hypothetical protein M408DRAFT_26535 [Serendipita vermifera MAFF 305830]|uniref:Uncharacterized protein n=1 Tax=Serendipita vermifera MAFF 305830 TaxID=933852 RepID=A0A0C3AKQ9_SERVB|nr:hypothetical protein M408DRAFT_26535 [Serendipita vermifera MAFF 305830]
MLNSRVQYLLLVGGFGDSQYLQKVLGDQLKTHGIYIVTTEEPSKKAAAEGAMIWYIKQSVMARIARTTIGVRVNRLYNPRDPEHVRRHKLVWSDLDGVWKLNGGFNAFVSKGTRMQSNFTHIKKFHRIYGSLQDTLGSYSCPLSIWEGEATPAWVRDLEDKDLPQLRSLCTLKADLSGLKGSFKRKVGPGGEYYRVDFRVAVRFGGTQLQARLQWDEGGVLREGPVTIIPNAII